MADLLAGERQVRHLRRVRAAARDALGRGRILPEIGVDRVDAGFGGNGGVLELQLHRATGRPGAGGGQECFDPGGSDLAVEFREVGAEIGAVADDRVTAHAVPGLKDPLAFNDVVARIADGGRHHLATRIEEGGRRQRDEKYAHQAEHDQRAASLQALLAGFSRRAAHRLCSLPESPEGAACDRCARSRASCSNSVPSLPRKA